MSVPYYAVIFTSVRTAEDDAGYGVTAERMAELLHRCRGILALKAPAEPMAPASRCPAGKASPPSKPGASRRSIGWRKRWGRSAGISGSRYGFARWKRSGRSSVLPRPWGEGRGEGLNHSRIKARGIVQFGPLFLILDDEMREPNLQLVPFL